MKVFIVTSNTDEEMYGVYGGSIEAVYAESAEAQARSHSRRIYGGDLRGPFEVTSEIPSWVLLHLPDPGDRSA